MKGSIAPFVHPSAWTGDELRQSNDWVDHLLPEEIAELDRALRAVEQRSLKWGEFGAADFPLAALAQRLKSVDHELRDGRGFVLLRGIPVERYSLDQIKTLYWGIGSHLGQIPPQNVKGIRLEEITDLKVANLNDPNLRGYVTRKGLDAHSDNSDTVALLCVDRAEVGGRSVIASMPAIFNKALAEHPEFIEPLLQGYRYDLRGEGVTGNLDETSEPVPVFSIHGGRVRGWFHRRLILGGAVKAGIELTELQKRALDFVADAAHEPAMLLEHDLQPGDIQLLNNYTAIHYRSPFEDGPNHKRLLLRLWVNRVDRSDTDPAFERSWITNGYQRRDWAEGRTIAALGNR
ncbi:MAG: TauD/TfdA family dioxygenase [Lautropia sp.]